MWFRPLGSKHPKATNSSIKFRVWGFRGHCRDLNLRKDSMGPNYRFPVYRTRLYLETFSNYEGRFKVILENVALMFTPD